MSMETDFRAVLAGDPGIVALTADRIYPATYDQGAASPAMRYMRVAGSVGLHMQGGDGLDEATVQVDVRVADIANAARVAMNLRDAVVSRLHGFRGVEGGTKFRLIALSSDRGVKFEKTDAGSFYTASLDFSVVSRKAAA